MSSTGEEYMTVSAARERLGISKGLMARWIRDGVLKTIASPFNKRAKLVLRADVEELARQPRTRGKEAA